MRKVMGIIVGLAFAAVLTNTFWTTAIGWFPPKLPDTIDEAAARAFVMTMPASGQAAIAVGWLLSGLIAAFIALRVAQWRPAGWIVGGALAALAVFFVTQMVQPLWLEIASVVLPLAGTWLAERHYHRARRGDPLIN